MQGGKIGATTSGILLYLVPETCEICLCNTIFPQPSPQSSPVVSKEQRQGYKGDDNIEVSFFQITQLYNSKFQVNNNSTLESEGQQDHRGIGGEEGDTENVKVLHN